MPLLSLQMVSLAIDRLNRRVGHLTAWFILASVVISAVNAVLRKAFGLSSNAWSEMQWYLFGAAFLLASGYVLMLDEHVRVDLLVQRLSARMRAGLDAAVMLLFVLPLCVLMVYLGGEYFWRALSSGERSFTPSGLIIWPVRLFIPLGFALLGLQALSETIKRVDFIRGRRASPTSREPDPTEPMGAADAARARP